MTWLECVYPNQDWGKAYKSHIGERQLIITGGNAAESFQFEKVFFTRWRSLYSRQSQRRSNFAPFLDGLVGSPPFS